MNCPSCGAPMRLADGGRWAVCDYCKASHVPEKNADGVRVFDQPSELACPLCRESLSHALRARQPVLYCTRCRGLLIAMPVFVLLVEALRAERGDAEEIAPPPDRHELDRRISCPRCGRPMDTHYYAGGGNVVIDDCSPCELDWLDAGELDTIALAPGQSSAEA